MKAFLADKKGFTLLEVLVALAIFGISLCILIALIGNSLSLAGRAGSKILDLELAKEKIDSAVLGTLGDPVRQGRGQTLWTGITEAGQGWEVEALPWDPLDEGKGGESGDADWFVYEVRIGNLTLSTLGGKPD